jgi:hypothetical protein
VNMSDRLAQALKQGGGCVYLGSRKYVLVTLGRWEEAHGGGDPGHDDNFPHAHLDLDPLAVAAALTTMREALREAVRRVEDDNEAVSDFLLSRLMRDLRGILSEGE